MTKSLSLTFLSFALSQVLASSSFATNPKECTDVESCIQAVSKITGDKYIMSRTVENRKIKLSENFDLDKDNAELVLTNVLYQNDLTRVPLEGKSGAYQIAEAKMALQMPIPVFEGSLAAPPTLPNTYDYVTLKYLMVDKRMPNVIGRYLTDLIPRNGRVTSYPDGGYLLITDSAMNIKRILEVLKSMDKALSKEALLGIEQVKKERASRNDLKKAPATVGNPGA